MSEKFSRLPMYLCVWCVAVVAACSPSSNTSAVLSSITSGTPTPTPTGTPSLPSGPTGAIPGPLTGPTKVSVTATFPTNVYSVLHLASDWTKSCTIDVNSSTASDKDVTCYLEAEEQDLYANNYTFTVTTPVAACPYVAVAPFYYLHFSWGQGPSALSYNTDGTTISSLAIAGGGTTAVISSDGSSVQCIFDHTTENTKYPNCCQGQYTATVTDTSAGKTAVKSGDWGGKIGNCARGPRTTDSQFKRDATYNLPVPVLATMYAGGTFVFSVQAPIKNLNLTNLTTANFVTDETNIPLPLRPFTNSYDARVYNEWQCLDGGGELLGRIRVLTREWTLASELAKGSLGTAHVEGSESNYPNNPPMPITYPKLDYIDWVTFATLGISYPGGDIDP